MTEAGTRTAQTAAELVALAARVPADGPPGVTLARQRAADAVEAVAAAVGADPTVAERKQRDLDVLAEVLRRLAPLARQVANERERQRLDAAGESAAHLGRTNPHAAEELDTVSQRCTVIAARITAAVLPDWNTPRRIRELSASRMPGEHELIEIADRLRGAVAAALDLPYPDPEAVRLAELAAQIDPHTAPPRLGRRRNPFMNYDFTADITARARWARDHNHGQPRAVWSTGEKLAVALILRNQAYLDAAGYTREECTERLSADLCGADVEAWLTGVRAALTQ